jgi:hypothetical protein
VSTELLGAPGRTRSLSMEVSDATGQETVLLENLPGTSTVAQVVAMASTALKLPPNIVWDLRHEESSRLLSPETTIGEVAGDTETRVRATLQPDAGLA